MLMYTKLHGARSHIQSISDPGLLYIYANFGKTASYWRGGLVLYLLRSQVLATFDSVNTALFPAAANTPSARAATAVRQPRGRVVVVLYSQ